MHNLNLPDSKPTTLNVDEPTIPGWYRNVEGAQELIYLRTRSGQWYVIAAQGWMEPCGWGYIEQAVPALGLVRMAPLA